jgi:hypothetical protein
MIPYNAMRDPAMAYAFQELAARRERVIPRVWDGQTVVVAGSGPSLTKGDLDFVRGRVPVVVVSRTYQLAPWADLLFSMESIWWEAYKPEFPGAKFSPSVIPPWIYRGVTSIYSKEGAGFSLDPGYIHEGCSGFGAINLALLMGARRIILLGFDCKSSGGKRHFFGDHVAGLSNPTEGEYRRWLEHYEGALPSLARAGVEVINCGRDTAITAFPRMTIEEALPWWGASNAAE